MSNPAPDTPAYTEDQAIAGLIAGHRMDDMPPTAGDIAAARRAFRGDTTPAEEIARVTTEINQMKQRPTS